MDIFDEEIIKFWKAMEANTVKYIMVGGFATNLHGYQRFTGDMDIWVLDTVENRGNLRKAFKDAGMEDYFMMETIQFYCGLDGF